MATITPFQFRLEKLSGDQLRLHEALFEFLPKSGIRETFDRAIREAFEKHVGFEVPYQLESVSETTVSDFQQKLAEPLLAVVVGMPPLEAKMFLDIDVSMALALVDRMLGGRDESPLDLRPLSEIEQGVLQYLLLQVMAHVHRRCGSSERVQFRFERFLFHAPEITPFAQPHDRMILLTFRVHLEKAHGFIRLCFPHPFIEGALLHADAASTLHDEERRFLLNRLKKYEDMQVPVWAEVGRTALQVHDLPQLERGDVVVLDQAEVLLEEGVPAGRVVVRCGRGEATGFIADLAVDGRTAHCRLTQGSKGE